MKISSGAALSRDAARDGIDGDGVIGCARHKRRGKSIAAAHGARARRISARAARQRCHRRHLISALMAAAIFWRGGILSPRCLLKQ